MPVELPTLQEFYEVAPITTLVLVIVGIGYWVGRQSTRDHIQTLKDWLDDHRKK